MAREEKLKALEDSNKVLMSQLDEIRQRYEEKLVQRRDAKQVEGCRSVNALCLPLLLSPQAISTAALVARVRAAAEEAEEESEAMALSFCDKEITVDKFVKPFLETRKLYHMRNAKAERFVLQQKGLSGGRLQ